MMSCLISLSKCPNFCLFWGSAQMQSGWYHAVDVDFQHLGLKSDCKEGGGGILGTKILNLNLIAARIRVELYLLTQSF
jgi:hypothetical protein